MSDGFSPYSMTPIKDFYLDVWVPSKTLKPHSSDKEITLEAKYDRRPDKLAKDLYGSERLWWVFSLRNKDVLIDPINDFKAGITIFVPASV
jgi:hypothetical protein